MSIPKSSLVGSLPATVWQPLKHAAPFSCCREHTWVISPATVFLDLLPWLLLAFDWNNGVYRQLHSSKILDSFNGHFWLSDSPLCCHPGFFAYELLPPLSPSTEAWPASQSEDSPHFLLLPSHTHTKYLAWLIPFWCLLLSRPEWMQPWKL